MMEELYINSDSVRDRRNFVDRYLPIKYICRKGCIVVNSTNIDLVICLTRNTIYVHPYLWGSDFRPFGEKDPLRYTLHSMNYIWRKRYDTANNTLLLSSRPEEDYPCKEDIEYFYKQLAMYKWVRSSTGKVMMKDKRTIKTQCSY